MNIHEYQAKEILSQFEIPVPKGIVILKLSEIKEKIKKLKNKNLVLKAQIHAGEKGAAGRTKMVNNINELKNRLKILLGQNISMLYK